MSSTRRAARVFFPVGAVAVLFITACSSGGDDGARAPGASPELAEARPGTLAHAFERAAEHTHVPRDLLVAVAAVEDGLRVPAMRDVELANEVPAAGPLQLRRGKLDTLARGAALVGAAEVDLRRDGDLALEAGARVLEELGARTGARGDDLASWRAAIAELSGFADDAHRESYVHDVFRTLARGGRFGARAGEAVVLGAHAELPPSLIVDVSSTLRILSGAAQYAGAEWVPTSCTDKCNSAREDGATIERIIIHDTEGGWNASLATLQNDPGKSAHYLVGQDGRVAQFVTEATAAWHSGNRHYNHRSIGIEHVGWHDQPFSEAEYAASAKLVGHLTTKYSLPKDRAHVIGHDQVPNGKRVALSSPPCTLSPEACQKSLEYGGASVHVDPGIWEWAGYMERFGGAAKCNDVTPLWKCSDDGSRAFRCAGGEVELLLCDSCDAEPLGEDDVCHVKARSSEPRPPLPGVPPPVAAVPETTGAPLPVSDEEGGGGFEASADVSACAVRPMPGSSATMTSTALAALGLVLGLRRRGRPRGRCGTGSTPGAR